MSGRTPARVLKAMDARDSRDGRECVWHGQNCDPETLVPQHRQGGMGGSKTKHRLSNVVWLDSFMNGDIEANDKLAQEARARGIKVPFYGDTTAVPVLYPDGKSYLLCDAGHKHPQLKEGGFQECPTPDSQL